MLADPDYFEDVDRTDSNNNNNNGGGTIAPSSKYKYTGGKT